MTNLDQMIEDLATERRHRMVLVVAAVIGIVTGALLGIASALGAMPTAGGPRNPAMLIFFVGPFAVSMGIGYAIYGLLRWRSARALAAATALPRATLRR
jgi:hypothetical protein